MAIEKNPNDSIPKVDNVIKLNMEQPTEGVNFELDPSTGEMDVEFNYDNEVEEAVDEETNFYDNLAESKDDLDDIASQVIEKFQADKESRSEWESMFERGFDLLGLKLEDTSEPFEGACTAVHPLLIESAVKFQSKASQELFPSKGPVKVQVLGEITESTQRQANRVESFMNYQLTEQMPEFFDEKQECI